MSIRLHRTLIDEDHPPLSIHDLETDHSSPPLFHPLVIVALALNPLSSS